MDFLEQKLDTNAEHYQQTSLALLGFVARNIAMPIVLMQLPEGSDPKKLNGTVFMLPGEGEEFVGPPGGTGNNGSMTVVVLPTEALNGLDLALPGLSGRRRFVLFDQEITRNGQRNGNGFIPSNKTFNRRQNETSSSSSLGGRRNTDGNRDLSTDPHKDTLSNSNWDKRASNQFENGSEENDNDQDGRKIDAYNVNSSSDGSQEEEISPRDEIWNRSNRRGGQGKQGQKEVVDSTGNSKDKRKGVGRNQKPKKPQPPSQEEDFEPQEGSNGEESSGQGSNGQGSNGQGSNNQQPSYGSRRTIWGYPTRGQVPYPSFIPKPYPKDGSGMQPYYPTIDGPVIVTGCTSCPSIDYPVNTGQPVYPSSLDPQQESFITLPDNEETFPASYGNYDSSNSGSSSNTRSFIELLPAVESNYDSTVSQSNYETQPDYGIQQDFRTQNFGFQPNFASRQNFASQPNYASNNMRINPYSPSSDIPIMNYDSSDPSLIPSSAGSLLELPFRSRIPSLLGTRTTLDPLNPPSSSSSFQSKNVYPMASLVDGRGQVSGYYIQTRRQENLQPSTVQNLLERLNKNTLSDFEVLEVSSGEGSTFIPLS